MANESKGLLARKLGMTQIFEEDGTIHGVTVLEVGPNTVLQVKTDEGKDGYNAVQLGFDSAKPSRLTKAELGHLAKSGNAEKPPRFVRELRLSKADASSYEVGQTITAADIFESGARIDVTGISKGKGYAGVMKRWNMKGFIRSHGTHEFFRHGGSIGTRLTPGMVLSGKKMSGQMGNEQKTIQNLQIVRMDAERNLLFVKGGVPGPNGAYIAVRQAVKA
ncbi:MAG: 50S ribosomal protein L3 [Alphaproteobacteria bacterium]|nr:50S ribosomal protein L3 [Alphaproteobacteria bacterium]